MLRRIIRRWVVAGLIAVLAAVAVLRPMPMHGQEEQSRKVKTKVQPTYPELARRMRLTGTVKVEVVVTPSGTPKSVKPIGGNPVLIDAALEAVKKWHWEAGTAETTELVQFRFVGPN